MIVTFIIPIAVATTVPLQGLRGDLIPGRVLMFFALGLVSLLIASQVWKAGLKQYSGASSWLSVIACRRRNNLIIYRAKKEPEMKNPWLFPFISHFYFF